MIEPLNICLIQKEIEKSEDFEEKLSNQSQKLELKIIENKERIQAKKSLTLTDQFLEVSEEESVYTNNMLDSNQPEISGSNRNVQSDKKLKIVRMSNIKKLKKKKIDAISEVDSEEMVKNKNIIRSPKNTCRTFWSLITSTRN